jgi:hypothetical protein
MLTRRRWIVVGGATGLILGTVACPLPMRYTERLAPTLVGVVRTKPDAALTGVSLAVSLDSDCRNPTAVATTDSTGAFHIAASDRPRRLAWIGPFEFPPPRPYYLCAGSRVVFTGGVPRHPTGQPPLRPVSLVCWGARGVAGVQLECTEQQSPP